MTDLFTKNAVTFEDGFSEAQATFEAGFSEAQVTSEVPKSLTDQVEKNTSDISDEVSNRTNADNALQTAVNAEAQTRLQADTDLQTNIGNEATARTNADNALQEKINTNKNDINELKSDLSNFNEENRNKFSMISKNLEREVDYEIIGTPNRLWSVDSNNNITELEGLYNYYASIDVIDISDAVSFDVSTQLAKNPYTSDGRISCPSILITDEDGKVLTSIMSNGEIQTLSDSVLINKYKYLYVNYNKVNESSVSIKKTIITSAVSQDYADSNNERVSLIEEDIRNEINKGIHPLILDMSADYWNTSIYSVKNNENDAYFSITANEGDEFVSITSSHNIDISSIGNDIKNAGNMCIVYDDGTVKPVNVWRKTDTQINVFPMVEKDITNGFLYTFQLNDIHLTEKGYIGYAQTVYNANPKYLDKSESLYRYRPRLSIENGNKKCYPFVSFGRVTDNNYSAQQTGQSFYSGQEYTIGYSESNVDNEIDSGFSWEVDLHKETGYVEAYVGLYGSRSSFSFTYSDQGAVMIDLYLDDVLVKRIEKTKAGLERICIDFANAKKGKIVIHKNKWTKYGHGFNIGNVTWYKSHPDYNKSALPKFSIPVVLFDSWSNMSFPAFGSALKNIINSDCGFNAPFYDESLGGSTIAWARQWFYDKVISDSADGLADEYDESKNYKLGERCVYKGNLYENFGASPGQFDKTGWGLICRKKKYKPTHVFIDHVLNDKGTSSGDTRYSTDSPTGEQYQFSTTKEEYLKWMKDVIDMAINNGIQPIICGNNKRYCESWYLALVDYLDTADDSNIYWSHD